MKNLVIVGIVILAFLWLSRTNLQQPYTPTSYLPQNSGVDPNGYAQSASNAIRSASVIATATSPLVTTSANLVSTAGKTIATALANISPTGYVINIVKGIGKLLGI